MQNAWNLMNDEKFGSSKLLKFKYGRENQMIQTFWKIGSPQKVYPNLQFVYIWRLWEKYSRVM